jgi:hypothetical protein
MDVNFRSDMVFLDGQERAGGANGVVLRLSALL